MTAGRYRCGLLCVALGLSAGGFAQDAARNVSGAPASVPAGVTPAQKKPASGKTAVTAKQARDADDAYIEGARQMERDDLTAAEKSFARAVALNPEKEEYVLSLQVAREHHVTELVQAATKARLLGDSARSDALLEQARSMDPENAIVLQHMVAGAEAWRDVPVDFNKLRARMPQLDKGIAFEPTPGRISVHERGGAQDVIMLVYRDFGIHVSFDPSYINNAPVKFDLEDVDFETATRVLAEMTHEFAVPVQPKEALVAKDVPELRDQLQPLIEETIYLPGLATETMTELANLARNVFDLRQVTASATGGYLMVRGEERTLRALNEIYSDMLDGGSDVLLDIHLYEIDKSHLVDIGASAPSTINAFSVVTTAQNLINANQSTLSAAISNGLLTLTGSAGQQQLEELEFLVGAGLLNSSAFSNLLGVLGTYGGLPLLGVSLTSSGTFNLLMNSSEVRILDQVQLRGGNNQDVLFRAGSRYPIETGTYSSGVSSGLASQLAGVTINGTSAAALLAQFGSSSNVTVPQIQYEDLGITLKATPRIERTDDVNVKLDLKIEALGSGTLNTIPVLNNRVMTSTVTIPAGQTALLASTVTRNELRDIEGVPGLSELPGFQGTDKSKEVDTTELLITVTPHIVREQRFRMTSRRILLAHARGGGGSTD